ncbi:MAG: hypothetical protein HC915_10905 [Anaerolineae bacterium]|nr:hypothetical protein [Anaerolineae bacterium]
MVTGLLAWYAPLNGAVLAGLLALAAIMIGPWLIFHWFRLLPDLSGRRVLAWEGVASAPAQPDPLEWTLHIGGAPFVVPELRRYRRLVQHVRRRQTREGTHYRVYYLPRSRVIVAMQEASH